MPYSYTPASTIQQRDALAQALMGRAMQPAPAASAGPLGNILSGVAGGLAYRGARNAEQGNQALRSQILQSLPSDPGAMAKYLLGQSDPTMQEMGLKLQLAQPSALDTAVKQSQIIKNLGGGKPAQLTPGQKSIDQAFGKEYASWRAGGGFAGVQKQLDQIQDAINKLKSGAAETGPYIGLLPQGARRIINPEGVNAQQDIEQAIQQSLRQVLGAQYTEKEGENLLKRTFDPQADEATNVARAEALLKQLRTMAQTKDEAAKYFAQHGTLQGWTGEMPNLNVPSSARSVPEGATVYDPQGNPFVIRNGQPVPAGAQ